MAKTDAKRTVADIMSRPVVTATADDTSKGRPAHP